MQLLGLYNVYHPRSHWKCPYCKVCHDDIHDFSDQRTWPMRTEEEVEADEKDIPQSISGQKKHARVHHSIHSTQILPFPRTHIIPCFLHCLSGIIQKLFKLLLCDTSLAPVEVWNDWETPSKTLKIKIAPDSDGKTFAERVGAARWGRPEWLHVLQHHKKFIKVVQDHAR